MRQQDAGEAGGGESLRHIPGTVSPGRGGDVVGRADLKRQVPEKCFPTDHDGNGTEESKHEQRALGRWWPQTLPTQGKAGPNMCHAPVGPAALPTCCGIPWGSAHRDAFLLWLHFIKVFLKSFRYP